MMYKMIACATPLPLLEIVQEKVLTDLDARYPHHPAIQEKVANIFQNLDTLLKDKSHQTFFREWQDTSKQRRHIADLKKAVLEKIDPLIQNGYREESPTTLEEAITKVKLYFSLKKPRLSQEDKTTVNACLAKLQTIVMPRIDTQMDPRNIKRHIIETIEAILCENKDRTREAEHTAHAHFNRTVTEQLALKRLKTQLENQSLVQKTLTESIEREEKRICFETQVSNALRCHQKQTRSTPSDLAIRSDHIQDTVSQITQRITETETKVQSLIQKTGALREENERLTRLNEANLTRLKQLKTEQHAKEDELQRVFVACEAEKKRLQEEIDHALAEMKEIPIQFQKDAAEIQKKVQAEVSKNRSTKNEAFTATYTDADNQILAQWNKFQTDCATLNRTFSEKYATVQNAKNTKVTETYTTLNKTLAENNASFTKTKTNIQSEHNTKVATMIEEFNTTFDAKSARLDEDVLLNRTTYFTKFNNKVSKINTQRKTASDTYNTETSRICTADSQANNEKIDLFNRERTQKKEALDQLLSQKTNKQIQSNQKTIEEQMKKTNEALGSFRTTYSEQHKTRESNFKTADKRWRQDTHRLEQSVSQSSTDVTTRIKRLTGKS